MNWKRDGMRVRVYWKGLKLCYVIFRYCGVFWIFCLLVFIIRMVVSEKENVRSWKMKSMVFECCCFIVVVFLYKCMFGVEFKGLELFVIELDFIVLEVF